MKTPTYLSIAPLIAAGIAIAGAPAIAGTSTKPEAQIEMALQGRTEGAPVNCINQQDINSSRIVDGTAILYEMNNGTIYLNRPASGASSLSDGDILVTDTHSTQLCNVDIVHLVDQGSRMEAGTVGLGKFVPWSKG